MLFIPHKLLTLILCTGFLVQSSCALQAGNQKGWQWQADKIKHFALSSLIAGATARQQSGPSGSDCNAALVGFSIAMTTGIGKEAYDKYIKKTYWDWDDIAWDLAGSSVGGVIGGQCY